MTNVFSSVASQINERVNNPIFLPFIISWSVLNHNVILYLLSTNAVERKLSILQEHFSWHSNWLNGFTFGLLYPFLLATGFVILYPVANRYLMVYWRWQTRLERQNLVLHEDENPLTREEARKIRRDAEQAVNELEVALEKKDLRNQALARENEELQSIVETANRKAKDNLTILSKSKKVISDLESKLELQEKEYTDKIKHLDTALINERANNSNLKDLTMLHADHEGLAEYIKKNDQVIQALTSSNYLDNEDYIKALKSIQNSLPDYNEISKLNDVVNTLYPKKGD